jgi:DNA-binding transcriptional LysR family regulator
VLAEDPFFLLTPKDHPLGQKKGAASPSELRVRPFADPAPKRTLALIWRKRSPFTGALEEVAGAMKDAWPRK